MRSAITVSLVPEANGGPFVFWNGLENAFSLAADLGFDGIEIFPSGPEALNVSEIKTLQERTGLSVAAIGTGAGWVKHKLHLTHADASVRTQARAFIGSMIRIAAELGAPAILGSMQGRVEGGVERAQALDWLGEALQEAGDLARQLGQVFLYEPLNRYETNLINRQADAAQFIEERGVAGVKILADLFHMNIEEVNLADTFRAIGAHTGHVHFADSTRRAIGLGHTDVRPIYEALKAIGYEGYLSAEVVPLPSSQVAAEQTMASFKALTANSL